MRKTRAIWMGDSTRTSASCDGGQPWKGSSAQALAWASLAQLHLGRGAPSVCAGRFSSQHSLLGTAAPTASNYWLFTCSSTSAPISEWASVLRQPVLSAIAE